MFCDFSPVNNFFAAASAAVGIAIVFAGLAVAALVFPWTWWLAPLFSGLAAASLGMAALMVNFAREALFTFYGCRIGDDSPTSRSTCWGAWANARNAIIALTTVLGITAATAAGLAGALLGWWSAPDLWAFVGEAVAIAAMIPTTIVFVSGLVNCLNQNT